MSDKNLAVIRKIKDISPIEGADKIVLLSFWDMSWQVVSAKENGFEVGNLVVYIATDTIVPECESFEFLRKHKFRVKTIKLRGQYSQGLVIPISDMEKFPNCPPEFHVYSPGIVTGKLVLSQEFE